MDVYRDRGVREPTGGADEEMVSHAIIRLGAQDSVAFARAILTPPAPNENLRALAERYREVMGK